MKQLLREHAARLQAGVLSTHTVECMDLLLSGRETARKQLTTTTTSQLLELQFRKKMQDYKWNQISSRLGQQPSFSLMPSVS